MDLHDGRLPIADGIDVISVGLTFLRFLEIAEKLNIPAYVVTDNDGDVDALKKKYCNYLDDNAKPGIHICFDAIVDKKEEDTSGFNYNTLEPKLLKANDLNTFNQVFNTKCASDDEMRHYMKRNKVECALAIFNSKQKINYPDYIMRAVKNEQ